MSTSPASQTVRQRTEAIYQELRRYASWALRGEADGHSMQTSDLVNETWLRLATLENIDWRDDKHLLRVAVTFVRRVLIDHARKMKSQKRQQHRKVQIDDAELQNIAVDFGTNVDLILSVDEALHELNALHPNVSEILQQRFYGGLELQEIADLHDISVSSVKRKLTFAKAWMSKKLDAVD